MTGIDPADLADHAIIGADYIVKGAVDLAGFTKRLVRDFGDKIKPFAEDIYKASQAYREAIDAAHQKNTPKAPPHEAKAKAYEKALNVRAQKLEERISRGDFTKPTKEIKKLTAEQQAELFAALQSEPPDHGLWSGPKVTAFVKDRFGVEVRNQTGWQWLKDLGFRLVVPRPRHPKTASPERQKEWL